MDFKVGDTNSCVGQYIIEDFCISSDSRFDPIAKIWATIRKKNRKKYGVDVAGSFVYAKNGIIACAFYPNYAGLDEDAISKYGEKFVSTFAGQMEPLEQAIIAFVDDGWMISYQELQEKTARCSDYEELFDNFLREQGLKN